MSACCGACAAGAACEPSCAGRFERDPSVVRLDLSAGQELGTASVPEIVQVYSGPIWLELWSFDSDTAWFVQRLRKGREGQRIVTDQRVNSGPVSRRIVRVSEHERATVRAWARAVAAGQGWNDTTGRYSASTAAPYIQVLTYESEPYEYGASSASSVVVAAGGTETVVAAHHARYLTVYADAATGSIQTLDRGGNITSTRPLSAYNVVNCADAWTRVKVTNTGAADIRVAWIATVNAPGMV